MIIKKSDAGENKPITKIRRKNTARFLKTVVKLVKGPILHHFFSSLLFILDSCGTPSHDL